MNEMEKHERLSSRFSDNHMLLKSQGSTSVGETEADEQTVNVSGMVNFSITISSKSASESFSALPWTMKYLGFRKLRDVILPGSLVSVAENSNFWQDDSFGSKKNDEIFE